MLAFTGVARKAWVSPVCGPLSTVPIPTICPRSLTWLAMVGKRLEVEGNIVPRSVITPSCQMKACDQLKLESSRNLSGRTDDEEESVHRRADHRDFEAA